MSGFRSLDRRHWLWPLLAAAPLLVMLQAFDLDRSFSNFFFDAASRRFPVRSDWWFTRVLHDGAKWLVLAFASALFGTWLFGFASAGLRRYRRALSFLLCAMAVSASAVSVLKHFSNHACPYDLAIYGGGYPRLAFFDSLPYGLTPGRCWPGGHASTAFSLFGLYFLARDSLRPQLVAALLACIILFGIVLSIAQTMRGAHFLSHQVWTALICWYATAFTYRWFYSPPRGEPRV